jgi:hypothetical protein
VTGVNELAERTRSALRAVDGARQALSDSRDALDGIIDTLTPLLADADDQDAERVLARYVQARAAVTKELDAMGTDTDA